MGKELYAGGALIIFFGIFAVALELAIPEIAWGLEIGIPAILLGFAIIGITRLINYISGE